MYTVYYNHQARITQYIIGICVVLFIFTQFNPVLFYSMFSLRPSVPTFNGFIMHAFMHGGILHLFFNMMALWQIGTILELSLGERRYSLLYVILLIGTGILTILFGGDAYYLGASGVIMGLFAYFYAVLPSTHEFLKSQLMYVLVINILVGFLPGVSFIGHFGGAVLGFLIGKIGLFQGWRFR